jgi:hypothetical protein
MKLVGMAVAMTAFGVSFYRWYRTSERTMAEAWFKKAPADS